MTAKYLELALTGAVREAQRQYYDQSIQVPLDLPADTLTPAETAFISSRDSFYLATVNEAGWPYIQHRGGPLGFLRVLDGRSLVFPDYKGNRQLISTGNLVNEDRVSLILVDYAQRLRLKLMGRARIEDARLHPQLAVELAQPSGRSVIERIVFIEVIAYDWNCPKYLTPRHSNTEVDALVRPLRERVAELEASVRALTNPPPGSSD